MLNFPPTIKRLHDDTGVTSLHKKRIRKKFEKRWAYSLQEFKPVFFLEVKLKKELHLQYKHANFNLKHNVRQILTVTLQSAGKPQITSSHYNTEEKGHRE